MTPPPAPRQISFSFLRRPNAPAASEIIWADDSLARLAPGFGAGNWPAIHGIGIGDQTRRLFSLCAYFYSHHRQLERPAIHYHYYRRWRPRRWATYR